MGAQTSIVQLGDQLIDREDPRVGELAAEALRADGITIHAGRTVARARPAAGGALITLDDGTRVETDVVITGARPRAQHRQLRPGHRGCPARPQRSHPGR